MANLEIPTFPHECAGLDYKSYRAPMTSDIKVSEFESSTRARRLRSCFARRIHQVTYVTCDKTCKEKLDSFYKNTILFGSKDFMWIEPCSQKKIKVSLVSGWDFRNLDMCFNNFELTIQLEEICYGD